MKKALILITAVIALCAVSSCKKEPVNEHPLEGVWGLTYMESSATHADPAMQSHSTKQEYDPFHPTTGNDCKLVCKWKSGDEYDTTPYQWDVENNTWKDTGIRYSLAIDGNKLLQTMDGTTRETGTISLQTDAFTIVSTYQSIDINSGEILSTITVKETFKKME